MSRTAFISGLLAVCVSSPAAALELMQCDRVTHISHGGETDHVDLGEGRVMWRDWWSQEGTATTFLVVDCAEGIALSVRAAEVNMGRDEVEFDRTDDVMAILDRHNAAARVFATLERIAEDLEGVGRDVRIAELTAEPCACAALYPDMRGDLAPFDLDAEGTL